MADITCAKCGEPWDAYGVDHGDMTVAEAGRFHKGEGCPSCGFGGRCPSCDGSGRDTSGYGHGFGHTCGICRDKGYVLAWEPHKQGGLSPYKVGHFYTGYSPGVREVADPDLRPRQDGFEDLPGEDRHP